MRNRWWWALTIGFACAASAAGAAPPAASPVPDAEVARRVEALLAQMTLEEKVGQLTQVAGGLFRGCRSPRRRCARAGPARSCGSTTRRSSTSCSGSRSRSRGSKIPVLFGLDVIHGYRTIFPVPLAMAASWDPVGPRAGGGGRGPGGARRRASTGPSRPWSTSPATPAGAGSSRARARTRTSARRWRRRRCAASRGRTSARPTALLACAKHFAAYGAAEGGRDYDPVYVSEGQLRNVFFPPFHAAVEAGVGSFMSAYMDLNDVPGRGQPLAAARRAARGVGLPRLRGERRHGGGEPRHQGFARDGADAAARAPRRRPRHGHGERDLPGAPRPPRVRRAPSRWRRSTRPCAASSR